MDPNADSGEDTQVTITVISTGFAAATRHLCGASVRAQLGGPYEHVYIEASEQDPPKSVTQNWYEAIGKLGPERIVVLLDGDDWLAHDRVLQRVAAIHERGALVSYGSYITSDGERGCCAPYVRNEYRREPWYASHLKTFRAGVFQQLTPEDLQFDGEWINRANDVAVMLPLLEMAGPDRVTFCEETLYIYHQRSSYTAKHGGEEEKEWEMRIRQKPSKTCL